MNESTKLEARRTKRDDYRRGLLFGKGIDVGCGPDPLRVPCGTVDRWDVEQGDAQELAGVPLDHYDFLYSSHCLEHLRDPVLALRRWFEVIRPNGILYVVVPDFVLYEGMTWPSRYNTDHKFAFTLWEMPNPTRAPLLNMMDLALSFGGIANTMRIELEDYYYQYDIGTMIDQTLGDATAQICWIARKK
jgi:SAM-dependent methyltransferase